MAGSEAAAGGKRMKSWSAVQLRNETSFLTLNQEPV